VIFKIKLKNTEKSVSIDPEVYEFFANDAYFKKLDFLNNLREHSTGCAVFQKSWPKADGTYKVETIYLHKFIAEKWLSHQRTDESNLVGCLNNNKLDCRIENLMFRSKSKMSRQRKSRGETGYNGVTKSGKKFRAIITKDQKHIHIGVFDTAEEAALAYNKKSLELFGEEGKQNVVKRQPVKIKKVEKE
jgi:hypothetical protein